MERFEGAGGLERFKKYCSPSGGKEEKRSFWVLASFQLPPSPKATAWQAVTGFSNMFLRRSLAKTPKILAPNGHIVF
jgi:hypothetical protein